MAAELVEGMTPPLHRRKKIAGIGETRDDLFAVMSSHVQKCTKGCGCVKGNLSSESGAVPYSDIHSTTLDVPLSGTMFIDSRTILLSFIHRIVFKLVGILKRVIKFPNQILTREQ